MKSFSDFPVFGKDLDGSLHYDRAMHDFILIHAFLLLLLSILVILNSFSFFKSIMLLLILTSSYQFFPKPGIFGLLPPDTMSPHWWIIFLGSAEMSLSDA